MDGDGAMNVVVVGGAGYVGSVLVRELLGHGHHVQVLDRLYFGDVGIRDIPYDQTNLVIADMRQFSDGSQYLNFPGFYEGGDKTMRTTFGEQYQRLVALKNKYDPTNFFRLNQNIKPAALDADQ